MNWLLIVTATIFAHAGNDQQAHVITFQTFETQTRCEVIATYINHTYGRQEDNSTTAQCVRN